MDDRITETKAFTIALRLVRSIRVSRQNNLLAENLFNDKPSFVCPERRDEYVSVCG